MSINPKAVDSGLSDEHVAWHLERRASKFLGVGNYPPDLNQVGVRCRDASVAADVAVFKHFGFAVEASEVARYAEAAKDVCHDYFYGDYLNDEPQASMQRKAADNEDLSWFEMYRLGLLFAFLSKDEDRLQSMVEWIEPWLPFDESSYLLTPQDNDYH